MAIIAIPGIAELWPILLIFVLLFGARKLPELARSMGTSITQFKRGLKEDDAALGKGSSEQGDEGPAESRE